MNAPVKGVGAAHARGDRRIYTVRDDVSDDLKAVLG